MIERMELTAATPGSGVNTTTMGPTFKSEEYYACAAFLFLFSFMGILENAILLKVLWERTLFYDFIYVVIRALCGAQLLMSAICLPMGALSAQHKSWLFHPAGCVFYAFLLNAVYVSNSFVLSAFMTVSAVVVCVPSVKEHITEKRTQLITAICFILGIIFALFPIGGLRHYVQEGFGFHCALDWTDQSQTISYLVAALTFIFLLPGCILLITLCITRYSIYRWNRTVLTEDIFELGIVKEDQRHARTASIVTGVILLMLTPYMVVSLQRIVGTAISATLVTATAILAQTYVTLTPFFIVLSLEKVRKALFKLVMPMEQMSRPVSREGSIIMARTGSRVQLRSRMGIYTRHNSIVPRSRMASDASMVGSLYSNAGVSYMLDDAKGAASAADKDPSVGSVGNDVSGFQAASAEETLYDSVIGSLVASRRRTIGNIKQTKGLAPQGGELDVTLPQVEEVSVSRTSSTEKY